MMCSIIPKPVLDSLHTVKACADDKDVNKVDAIFGAYRDENGKPWILPFVHDLERKIFECPSYNHEYVVFLGMVPFQELTPQVILGADSPDLKSGRAFGVQTVSGTAALRAGAELLLRHFKYTTFYISEPTWDNHDVTFLYAGFADSRRYRFWDPVTRGLDMEGLLEDLRNAPEHSVIVLQMCAHNPTGCDFTKEQWIQIADVMEERNLFPFLDAAYQGLATGDLEEDAWPARYFAQRGFEFFIAQSFSKNMGLYGDRVGCLTLVLNDEQQKQTEHINLLLASIIRALYLCPTRHGPEIVVQTLRSPELTEKWSECIRKMVKRITEARKGLRDRLEKLGTPGKWDHLTNQKGMFSFSGLTAKQVEYLGKNHHIYILPNGRTNMCAFNEYNLDRVAAGFHDAVIKCPK